MKMIMFLLVCASLVFAVKPVPRPVKNEQVKDPKTSYKVVQHKDKDDDKNDDRDKDDGTKDRFIDKNDDGVNDQREDAIQDIKNSKSKDKDRIKTKKPNTPTSDKKPAVPKKVNKK